jgi:hypothetical protein
MRPYRQKLPDVTPVGADRAGAVATWLWRAEGDIRQTVDFVTARRLREVCVSVPLRGVDEDVANLTHALRAKGIAVSCLGGDPMWAVEHDTALNWAFRATTDAVFDGVHLDVEPWALPGWPRDAPTLMASYAVLVEEMAEVASLAVDLAPWLADDHGDVIGRVAQQCDSVTVLAYRDNAEAILAAAAGMIALCDAAQTHFRIGVETQPPSPAVPDHITFGDDGQAAMEVALTAVAEGIQSSQFDGFAVHHLGTWRAMRS